MERLARLERDLAKLLVILLYVFLVCYTELFSSHHQPLVNIGRKILYFILFFIFISLHNAGYSILSRFFPFSTYSQAYPSCLLPKLDPRRFTFLCFFCSQAAPFWFHLITILNANCKLFSSVSSLFFTCFTVFCLTLLFLYDLEYWRNIGYFWSVSHWKNNHRNGCTPSKHCVCLHIWCAPSNLCIYNTLLEV